MKTDVLIVGAGVAGLAAAIKLRRSNPSLRVMVLDKGRSIGSHILSGAIVDPAAFKDLLTEEEIAKIPCEAKVVKESFRCNLWKGFSLRIPWVPPMMSSKGFPVMSLTRFVQYLATLASAAGVEIYTGYAVTSLIEEDGRIVGVRTGEKGLDKDGKPKSNHLASEEVRAQTLILAEGAHGFLAEQLIAAKGLQGKRPQTFALGIKQLIEVPAGTQKAGEVMHTFGWPADFQTYGGGFCYHVSETLVALGYCYSLDYAHPTDDPYALFKAYKESSAVRRHIKDGKVVAYGAKIIPEGGYYSAPTPYFPGCLIVGDSAGLLDSLRIKGVHIAMQSGVAAAEAILANDEASYIKRLHATRGWREMKRVRNVRAAFNFGMAYGVIASGLAWLTHGLFPFCRLHGIEHEDREALRKLGSQTMPPPVDRLGDLFLSGTIHEENQPCHLKVDAAICRECVKEFGAPCTLFCSAQVYVREDDEIKIDFSNCMHCKTCQIKCPKANVHWTPPQGGDGPRYTRM